MFLVGITGAAGAGKDTVADVFCQEFGAIKISLADPIRDMLEVIGIDPETFTSRTAKEAPHPALCGKTVRHGLRSLGTGWGRDMISHDIWVKATERKISKHWLDVPSVPVIIPDVRFFNEAMMVQRNGGYIVRVRRSDVEPGIDILSRIKRAWRRERLHPSEWHWRNIPADFEVHNNGSRDHLIEKLTGVSRVVRDRVSDGTPVPYLREVAA